MVNDSLVLLVGLDAPVEARIRRSLQDLPMAFRVEAVAGFADSIAMLEDPDQSLLLAPLDLPPYSGQALVRAFRSQVETVSLILLDDSVDESRASACIQVGARDVMGFMDLTRLPAVVRRELELIAARRHSQASDAALRESNRRFQFLANHIEDVFWISTKGGAGADYVSPGFERMWGFPVERVYEDHRVINSIVHPDDLPVVRQVMERYHSRGLPYEVEYRIHPRPGETRWVRERGFPVRGDSDEVTYMTGVVTDISEAVEARKALEREHRQVKQYFDIARVILIVVDLEGRITRINQYACDRLGGREHELLGRSFLDTFIPLSTREQHWERFGQTLRGDIAVPEGEILGLQSLDGQSVQVRWSGALLHGPDGSLEGMLGAAEDVTEERRLQGMLAQVDRYSSMGLMAAGIAHEINNPLTYMRANLEMLMEDIREIGDTASGVDSDLLSDVRVSLEDTRRGVLQIQEINKGLGLFSRVLRDTEPEWIDIHDVLDLVAVFAHNEIKYKAKLTKDYVQLPPVQGSDGRLAHVMLNLLLNAAQSIDEGHTAENQITLSTRQEGEWIRIDVADTGCGIPNDSIEQIFEPHFSTKAKGTSSGMGLSTSRAIVDQMGGRIEVTSELGRGSTFTVWLPIQPDQEGGIEPEAEAPPRMLDRSLHILVIDDDRALLSMMKRMLRSHTVTLCSNGVVAKDTLVEGETPDLIISDLMMPEISGMDLYTWVREESSMPDMPMLFMSGGVFTQRARKFLEDVDPPLLRKPFREDELSAAIATLIA